jgi:GNAT superfamily N-acetyltransferase
MKSVKNEKILIKPLTINECDFIRQIDASMYIKRAYREVNGKRQLVEINYHDPDWPNGYENHLNNLKETIQMGGCAWGAFNEDDDLLGFVTLNNNIFGNMFQYVLLDQLFIDYRHRNRGIGKQLFMQVVEVAKSWKVDRIYICAGSAEETIQFYLSIGCQEAEEINPKLYEEDPRDFQLEYILK